MFRAILTAAGILILLVGGWYLVQVFRTATVTTNAPTQSSFFGSGSLADFGAQLTDGLGIYRATTEPPIVTTDELGEISPSSGLVEIVKNSTPPSRSDVAREYVLLRARADNAQPVNITNWSLQSMISDSWFSIPQGVRVYRAGEVNELHDIYLRPGETAIVATKSAPVGVAFRANRCSGFLGSVQEFEPKLTSTCIAPRELLPPTVANITTYGEACVDFAQTFDSCTYLTSATPGFDTLSPACREYLQPRLTYNFCLDTHAADENFFADSHWRVFLGRPDVIWREHYEVIRLLDAQGRTVDAFPY